MSDRDLSINATPRADGLPGCSYYACNHLQRIYDDIDKNSCGLAPGRIVDYSGLCIPRLREISAELVQLRVPRTEDVVKTAARAAWTACLLPNAYYDDFEDWWNTWSK